MWVQKYVASCMGLVASSIRACQAHSTQQHREVRHAMNVHCAANMHFCFSCAREDFLAGQTTICAASNLAVVEGARRCQKPCHGASHLEQLKQIDIHNNLQMHSCLAQHVCQCCQQTVNTRTELVASSLHASLMACRLSASAPAVLSSTLTPSFSPTATSSCILRALGGG